MTGAISLPTDGQDSGLNILPPALPALTQTSLAEQVADAIVEGIATDVFPSDGRIVEMDICSRLDVSRIPVREALKILEAQGILISAPRRGFRVTRLDDNWARQVQEVRLQLETIAVRHAAQVLARRPDEAAGLDRLVAEMAARAERNEWSGPDAMDIAFHREICRVSENQIVGTLWEAIARHIRVLFGKCIDAQTDPGFLHREHKAFCAILKDGDADVAEREIRTHLRPTRLRSLS